MRAGGTPGAADVLPAEARNAALLDAAADALCRAARAASRARVRARDPPTRGARGGAPPTRGAPRAQRAPTPRACAPPLPGARALGRPAPPAPLSVPPPPPAPPREPRAPSLSPRGRAPRAALAGEKPLADGQGGGKSVDGLVTALVADAQKRIDAAVDDGRLTQEQANQIEQDLREHMTDFVNREPGELRFGEHPLHPGTGGFEQHAWPFPSESGEFHGPNA